MKCYLHIGSPKTASTTIQTFLLSNKKALEEENYSLYVDDYQEVLKLPIINIDEYKVSNNKHMTTQEDYILNKVATISSKEELDEFRDSYTQSMQEYFKKSKCTNTIISAESIYVLFKEIDDIKRLKDIIHSFGFDEIKVILYIREQIAYINSFYAQAIRCGFDHTEADISDYYVKESLNFGKLEKFAEVFGRENLDVRLFEIEEFKNGDIIDDLLDAMEYRGDVSKFVKPQSQNEGISPFGIKILAGINKKEPEPVHKEHNYTRVHLSNVISSFFGNGKYQMPYERYLDIVDKFDEDNELVREKYFPQKEELFRKKEYKEQKEESNINAQDFEDLTNSFVELGNEINKYKYGYVIKTGYFAKLLEFVDSLDESMRYVIYGYGTIGKMIYRLSEKKENLIVVDKSIKPIDELASLQYDKIIISVLGREKEIIKELQERFGIDKDKFLAIDLFI
jgi:hypothetical protein